MENRTINTGAAEAERAKERHRNLDIWKNAVALTARIYEIPTGADEMRLNGAEHSLSRLLQNLVGRPVSGRRGGQGLPALPNWAKVLQLPLPSKAYKPKFARGMSAAKRQKAKDVAAEGR